MLVPQIQFQWPWLTPDQVAFHLSLSLVLQFRFQIMLSSPTVSPRGRPWSRYPSVSCSFSGACLNHSTHFPGSFFSIGYYCWLLFFCFANEGQPRLLTFFGRFWCCTRWIQPLCRFSSFGLQLGSSLAVPSCFSIWSCCPRLRRKAYLLW